MSLQPTLPPPVALSEIELAYIDEEPPGLWPENQDSNFGTHRKIFCDELMTVAGQLDLILNEKFIATSTTFLKYHEEELGLTQNPAGKSITQRRATLLARRKRGPFSHSLVNSVVEAFISATFGAATVFGTGGITLGGGVTLFSGASGDPKHYYRVYYDIRNYAYAVWIASSVTPDLTSLLRELQRITPAGITVTIDNTHADVLSYWRTIRNDQPNGYYQLDNDATDFSGYGNNGTFVGAPTSVATLVSAAAGGVSAMSFNGTSQYMTIPYAVQHKVGQNLSVEAWIKPNAIVGGTSYYISTEEVTGGFGRFLRIGTTGHLEFGARGNSSFISSPAALTVGTVYHVVVTMNGPLVEMWINGVKVASTPIVGFTLTDPSPGDILYLGRRGSNPDGYFNGVMDEWAYYNYHLSDAQILAHYNTGINVV